MLFTSTAYLLILPLGFCLYWWLLHGKSSLQNLLLFLLSLVLYGIWDLQFLGLMLSSALINYLLGIQISEKKVSKKVWIWIGIIYNLLILLVFKYFDFFLQGIGEFVHFAGLNWNLFSLKLLVPLGLSYFTFQSIGYLMDCNRAKIENPRSPDLFLLLMFFPKVIAGPIERSAEFLSQIRQDRYFNYDETVEGLRQILWGLFKKIVIADNIAIILNILSKNETNTGSTVLVSVLLYSIQIYADFSGYSDIAIGSSRLFGIKLMQNFNYPYFSGDIREFWRRWHMSLMTWFRDYLFLPISYGLSRKLKKDSYLSLNTDKLIYGIATFITFILCGFWHGSSWNYITWGLINAVWFLPFILSKKKKRKTSKGALSGLRNAMNILMSFLLVTFTWIFFKSQNIHEALGVLKTIFSPSLLSIPEFGQFKLIILIPLMFYAEWKQRDKQFALSFAGTSIALIPRWLIYLSVLSSIYFLGAFSSRIEFLYFGF